MGRPHRASPLKEVAGLLCRRHLHSPVGLQEVDFHVEKAMQQGTVAVPRSGGLSPTAKETEFGQQ